ncbi:hypothetical protein QNZ44_003481 [Enterobacter kobei]|uniref:hypothetical protein n=1 Tax=Enterobacter TaxID=547 RepID=UPI001F3AC451|nr:MULTISPECIES: hypothetical protein [Enterobacter]MCF8586697.1 hypothetical protein [Enterobacter asburiae]MCK6779345.1 hypothetical protein [Enterobacter bugandensis]MDW3566523.1 hypothetical protein [Enterobacter asburiae]DAZ46606.1 MAG TPA: Transcriptional regulator [Caudoviricetes sp.]
MDTKEIRRKRLAAWFSSRTLPEKEKSYLSQLINGKASFGERAARRIERDYGMAPGYLDEEPMGEDIRSPRPFDARHEELLDLFDSLAEWEKEQHMVNLRAQVNSIDNELKARLKGKSKQEILQMLKDLEID